jgi:flagellar protein FliO/FliZ
MTEADVLRLVVSLGFVVALILAAAWLTKRAGWMRNGNNQALKVVATQSLGARNYVALIEVEDARLVVGITTSQISLLHTLPPAAPDNPQYGPDVENSGFAGILGNVIKRR